MNRSFAILFFILLAFVFKPLYPQTSILDTEVSFTKQKVTVKEFLFALETMGGFTFSYGKDVPVSRTIELSGRKQSIREYLDEIFQGDSLKYIEKGNKILIVPSSSPGKTPVQTVRGRVVDQVSRIPLIGVNILLGSEGPIIGTITDANGYFRFENVPVGRHDIICSSIGYKPSEITNLLVSSGKEERSGRRNGGVGV